MALDLAKTAAQLDRLTGGLRARRIAWADALAVAQTRLLGADPGQLEAKRQAAGRHSTWLAAGLRGELAGSYAPPPLPTDYAVVATDGSHIDVDRHSPARSSLINTGHVSLRYGELADAQLWSTPILYTDENELNLRDPESDLKEQRMEGPLLGIKRTVLEIAALAEMVESMPPGLPVLALVDGSLILWGLSDREYPEYVRRELLENGLLPALERLRVQARQRPLAVAAYISLPGGKDVVNSLRLDACPYDPVDCDRHCRTLKSGERPCDQVAGITDRDLFGSHLPPGSRSPLYRSSSPVVRDYYGEEQQVLFFYLHAGEEIARVELPAWSAEQGNVLGFAHAALVAQVEKGHGYPVALSEAHEQAVVTTGDRLHFELLVEEALATDHLPVFTSEKARSKRTRYV